MKAYVYILSTGGDLPVLYTGVTNDLLRRVFEHKQGTPSGFTSRYKVTKLVYFEEHDSIVDAILREKKIKHWKREWKLQLIEEKNPSLSDLYENLTDSRSEAIT